MYIEERVSEGISSKWRSAASRRSGLRTGCWRHDDGGPGDRFMRVESQDRVGKHAWTVRLVEHLNIGATRAASKFPQTKEEGAGPPEWRC